MNTWIIKSLCSMGLLLAAATGQATLITDGSFESNVGLSGKGWGVFQKVGAWTAIGGAGIEVERGTIVNPQHEFQYVELDSHSNSAMAQTISGLAIGQNYELTFWYRARVNRSDDNDIVVLWGEDIDLALNEVFSISGLQALNTKQWRQYTVSLTATDESMAVGFAAAGTSNSYGGFLDNIAMSSVSSVAESGSLVLMALGFIGLARSRRGFS